MSESKHPPTTGVGQRARRERIDAVYRHLEEGEVLEGLERAQSLAADHPQDGEAALAHAAAAYEAGFSREALGAARDADQFGSDDESLARFYASASLFRLWKFDEARLEIDSSLRLAPDLGDAWYLLAQICEMQSDEVGARRGYQQAATIDADRFPRPIRFTDEDMDRAIASATQELPRPFVEALDQVPIIVQPLLSWDMVAPESEAEEPFPPDVLGLFVGSSRLDQSVFNPVEHPGVIFLFQTNLERICFDTPTLEEEIRITVWHELGHYLGFDEEDMEEMGLD